jgi:hypothetical protein
LRFSENFSGMMFENREIEICFRSKPPFRQSSLRLKMFVF